ncbi:DNA polymerase III subunit chi [Ramlibacter tataouinensis]|uniref:DNA polymerase III subunit chi n=1 Tax=Ramlibacter tataouinensis TaxID=94132 RepID=UPI0022F400D6|nr:DNA polymerase III subunit chi [Ramlibacter tataouinensis]WBY02101.1 DNA polymerase III subunit chi [Ramlibacter tataouinensis]
MTEVAFHFNAPDKLGYACRLVRKAWGTGAQVVVTGEDDVLRELDIALWSFSPLDFLPHCHDAAQGQRVQARSPIVLASAPRSAPHQQVLVNLGAAVPEGFERFERLIEVVSAEPDDRQHGRRRWRHYKDRGYAVDQFEVGPAR